MPAQIKYTYKKNNAKMDAARYVERERAVLTRCNAYERLEKLLGRRAGTKIFAELFYFVRVQFVRHNFIIGAKCPYDERYWRGVVSNLMEELGGSGKVSHNELYRRFLYSVGGAPESQLKEPGFAKAFNCSWEKYLSDHNVEQGLYAIAIYEALDNPDYEMLLNALTKNRGAGLDLDFFCVHAQAKHTELFSDFLNYVESDPRTAKWEADAAEFVFGAQEKMWMGLIAELERI